MVLAQPEIRAEVDNGRIVFDPPLEECQWGQASVDLRLGFSFTKLKQLPGIKFSAAHGIQHTAAAGFWDTMSLSSETRWAIGRRFRSLPVSSSSGSRTSESVFHAI